MRDGDDGAAVHQAIQCLPDGFLQIAVECGGGLVEQKNGRVLEKGARDADALALAAARA